MLSSNEIYLGDCLDVMKQIDDKSIDMILCDLPYGVTSCKWDIIIPLDLLWKEYKRIIKDRGAIVLIASNPFAANLIMSNPTWYRHEWIWQKTNGTNPMMAKFSPMKTHELILIFGKKSPQYYPRMQLGKPYKSGKNNSTFNNQNNQKRLRLENKEGLRYPHSIQKFRRDSQTFHSTQKPVSLFSYLIKTYSQENDLILDNCAGSGTTGIACKETNRNYILIEKDEHFYNLAKERLKGDVNLKI